MPDIVGVCSSRTLRPWIAPGIRKNLDLALYGGQNVYDVTSPLPVWLCDTILRLNFLVSVKLVVVNVRLIYSLIMNCLCFSTVYEVL